MPTSSRIRTKRTRRGPASEELLVWQRERKEQLVAFEWRDGAGELHFIRLTAAQSWPYLKRR